jgi:hypothetical protein
MRSLSIKNYRLYQICLKLFSCALFGQSQNILFSIHPKTPNLGFKPSAISTQLSAKSNYNGERADS